MAEHGFRHDLEKRKGWAWAGFIACASSLNFYLFFNFFNYYKLKIN